MYKLKGYLIIDFNILQHNAWYTWSCLQKCWSFQSQQLEHVWNMFTVNNKNTEMMPSSSFLILNSFHPLSLCLSSWLWAGRSLLGRMISQTKPLKIKYFLPFNFSITNICVAIRLAEDGTRMAGFIVSTIS